ncbi:MAG: HEAT repeat domain-containing protein, partial [Lentisphaerae bacterium]|nr:HEAT repeat domain-containing protein [Lentisphaerota bacterium]
MICPLHPHHRLREVSSLLGLLFLLATVAAHRAVAEPNNAARRRAALLSAQASGSLTRERAANALTDSDPLVRRAAVACLAQHGKDAIPQLLQAIANTDPLVRRNAALSLGACGPDALDALKRAGRDAEPLVRHGAVLALMALEPRSIGAFNLLRRATEDGDNTVQQAASLAVAQYTEVLEGIRLPREGWKFKLD